MALDHRPGRGPDTQPEARRAHTDAGKRSLTEALPSSPSSAPASSAPVQRRVAAGPAPDGAPVHEAAERGTATPSSRMPFADRIQQLFGRHDVSSIQAHTGPDAAASTQAMGAAAYATGDHVVFGGAPDLHTAAHEAAHVVQQRAGVHLKSNVGAAGDPYEAHADRVADHVVQGRSAEPVLDEMVGGGGGGGRPAVQRKLTINTTVLDKNTPLVSIEQFAATYQHGTATPPARVQIIRELAKADQDFAEADLQRELSNTQSRWLENAVGKERKQATHEERSGLIQSDDQGAQRLQDWYAEPTALKQQTGQAKHGQLLAHVIADLTAIQTELRGKPPSPEAEAAMQQALVDRLPAALLYLAHNSSHAPPQGLAKVQGREANNPLVYFRSQSDSGHPHEQFYFDLIDFIRRNVKPSNMPGRQKQIMPSQPAMKALVKNNAEDDSKIAPSTEWNVHDTGAGQVYKKIMKPVPVKEGEKPKDKTDYDGPIAAYVGMRKSNAHVYSDGLAALFTAYGSLADGIGQLITFLKAHYELSDAPVSEPPAIPVIKAEIVNVRTRLAALEASPPSAQGAPAPQAQDDDAMPVEAAEASASGEEGGRSLFHDSLASRSSFSETLAEAMSTVSLSRLTVFASKGQPNLSIQTGAPPFTTSAYKVDMSYHQDGWNNAVLCFFGGLLNHVAAVHGQPVFVTRRQSFGFLRPTLTDTKESLRLSLGAQPIGYANVIIEALCSLDAAISSFSPAAALRALRIVEDGDKGGDRVMRYFRSDAHTALAYNVAQSFAAQGAGGFNGFIAWVAQQDDNTPHKGGYKGNNAAKRVDTTSSVAPPLAPLEAKASQNTMKAKTAFETQIASRPEATTDLIGAYLRDVLMLANQKLAQYGDPTSSELSKTERWALTRLLNNVQKGMFVLSQPASGDAKEDAARFSKATIVIEDILENMMGLSGAPGRDDKGKGKGNETAEDKIAQLLTERYGVAPGDIHVYHTGSGQQAGAATVFAAVDEYRKEKSLDDKLGSSELKIRVAPNEPYFEFDNEHMLGKSNLSQVRGRKGHAQIGEVMDIHPYQTKTNKPGVLGEENRLVTRLKELKKERKAASKADAYTLAVDVTNCDLTNPKIGTTIAEWQTLRAADPRLRLVLFGSLLKNEELGLDKHQAGRVIALGAALPALDDLNNETRHPLVDEMLLLLGQLRDIRRAPPTTAPATASPPSAPEIVMGDDTLPRSKRKHGDREDEDTDMDGTEGPSQLTDGENRQRKNMRLPHRPTARAPIASSQSRMEVDSDHGSDGDS
jgi:hypothetical protein